jgi:16S rRNA (cytosine1402-N4)-methyltransferase
MTETKKHLPVMENEVLKAFSEQTKVPHKFLDGTFGRGGHTRALLKKFPDAKVYGFDRDEEAVAHAKEEFSLEIKENRLSIVHDDFRNFSNHNLGPFDGALFDLGVSSPQFDAAERGFSIQNDGPLDMRMDRRQELTAAEVINTYSEKELSDIFYKWGEIRHPNRVVRAIVHDRSTSPFTRTRQLASLIERVERAGGAKKKIHLGTPYFMALRIAVNGELENLAEFFKTVPKYIDDGGRVVVISFHSLEDRIVKWVFRSADKIQGKIITKKVVIPSDEEIEINPRARSAKLRVFEKGADL